VAPTGDRLGKDRKMVESRISGTIQHLRSAVLRDGACPTDGQLLGDFIDSREGAPLAALVRRHGPMVWGVCRRILGNHHDAEDAFQATFLVLVRKAASVAPREMVGNWLYGVARQTALKARATAGRRKGRERQVAEMPEPAGAERGPFEDVRPLLDQELARLPDKYRAALVLCDLEGRTRTEAARHLGVPEGTLAARVARGRVMLAKRLTRRGVVLSAGATGAVLSHAVAAAGVPGAVLASTIDGARSYAAGRAGVPSDEVAALTEGVLRAMSTTTLKGVMTVLLALGLPLFGAGLLVATSAVAQPPSQARGKVPSQPPAPPAGPQRGEAEKLFRKMDKQLSEAKTLRIAAEGSAEGIEDLRGGLKYKGTVFLAQGNKARFEMEGEIEGKKQKMVLVSDGTRMVNDIEEFGKRPRDTPKDLFEVTVGFFKHGGPVAGYVLASAGPDGNATYAKLTPSAFKLGQKEKVGRRQAQVIEYLLSLEDAPKGGEKVTLSETLWLDTETNLPLRRVFTGKLEVEFTYTEQYSEFAVNPKLDDKLFELPR
jgi:RNA polymerase sigma factor (sigma-70 family)